VSGSQIAELRGARDRGLRYLEISMTSDGFQSGISMSENMTDMVDNPSVFFPDRDEMPTELFTSLLVLDLAYKSRPEHAVAQRLGAIVKDQRRPAGHFDFFFDLDLLPTDVDCTSIASSLFVSRLVGEQSLLDATVDRVVENVDDAGVIEVYLPPVGDRHYVDPTVCANALHLLYTVGQQGRARPTVEHVYDVLVDEGYLDGTRYYPSPDAFLVFAARMATASRSAFEMFGRPVQVALERREPGHGAGLHVAMRLLARCWAVGDPSVEHDQ
jgi:hypothetical protein